MGLRGWIGGARGSQEVPGGPRGSRGHPGDPMGLLGWFDESPDDSRGIFIYLYTRNSDFHCGQTDGSTRGSTRGPRRPKKKSAKIKHASMYR